MEREDNYNNTYRLEELGGSDYEIADNQPNIKGWTVKNTQGETIGEVEELIFDPQARKVRYMVVDLEGSVLDLEPRDVLVPIGIAELHESEDEVVLPQVTAYQLRALPTYQKGVLDRHTESSVRYVFENMTGAATGLGAAAVTGAAVAGSALHNTGETTSASEEFYNHQHFRDDHLQRNRPVAQDNTYVTPPAPVYPQDERNEQVIPIIEENLEVGKREVETGSAHISSRIVERPIEEPITLREEHVHVERTPVNRPATDSDLNTFQEGVIELREHAEVPVVNKEARVVEEVSLEKEVEERDEVIRDTVRSTEVDIDRLDTPPNDPNRINRDYPDLDNDDRTRV